MKPKITKNYCIKTSKILLVLFVTMFSFSIATAQNDCDAFSQTLSVNSPINDCGQNGVVNISIVEGVAPFNFTIENTNTNLSGSATTSSRSLNIALSPGTYKTTIIDANGCETTRRFNFYARNFSIKSLQCTSNGLREVQFRNRSRSALPVTVQIGASGFTLSRGTSVTLNLPSGVYTATVSRPGCASYEVAFSVKACPSAKSNNKKEPIAKPLMVIEEAVVEANVLLYPNPTVNNITIDLGEVKASSAVLYNNKGIEVLKETLSGDKPSVNTSKLRSGIYFLHLIDENGAVIQREKIIKK